MVIFLIGNKLDLESERTVSFDEGLNLAEKINATYFEVSARTKENIAKIF